MYWNTHTHTHTGNFYLDPVFPGCLNIVQRPKEHTQASSKCLQNNVNVKVLYAAKEQWTPSYSAQENLMAAWSSLLWVQEEKSVTKGGV